MIDVKIGRDNPLVRNFLRCLALAVGFVAGGLASAQQDEPPNGVFLVAKPGLLDPNFRQTVVLVTQAPDFSTVGVIVNRPTVLKLQQFLPQEFPTDQYRDRLFFGGPVMRQVIVALFRAEEAPEAPAFHVLKDLYLSLHPDNLRRLLAGGATRYRLYAGFAAWAPRQLESEFRREGWYVLPANVEAIFRRSTEGLWQELVQHAENRPVRTDPPPPGAAKRKAPPEAGL